MLVTLSTCNDDKPRAAMPHSTNNMVNACSSSDHLEHVQHDEPCAAVDPNVDEQGLVDGHLATEETLSRDARGFAGGPGDGEHWGVGGWVR